jgi:hypothetical protein
VGRFLRGRPSPAPTPVTARVPQSMTVRTRLSAPSSPPLLTCMATLVELPPTSRPPVTTPRHNDSRVFACHLEPSHQLRCVVASHRRCSPAFVLVGVALVGFWSRLLGDEVLEQVAPLVKLPLPNACRGGHCLALPTCARSCIDRVCWHSMSYRVAHLGSDASSTSPPPAAKGQCHARVASTRGCRSSRSLCHLRLCMNALMTGRGRAIPSTPSTLAHIAIKGTFPMHFVHATGFLSVGKSPPHFPRSLSAMADMDSPPHCLSLPLCRSRGPFNT